MEPVIAFGIGTILGILIGPFFRYPCSYKCPEKFGGPSSKKDKELEGNLEFKYAYSEISDEILRQLMEFRVKLCERPRKVVLGKNIKNALIDILNAPVLTVPTGLFGKADRPMINGLGLPGEVAYGRDLGYSSRFIIYGLEIKDSDQDEDEITVC